MTAHMLLDLNALLEDLKWAPSAHNVQALRLKRLHDFEFETCSVPSRHLPVADPHKKDLETSLGAFVEGVSLALSKQGFKISSEQLKAPDVVRFTVEENKTGVDPLAEYVGQRFSFRGKFKKPSEAELARLLIIKNATPENVTIKVDLLTKQNVAKKYDEVNLQFLTKPGYIAELYSWMRFSKSHLQWSKDGLNTEAVALHGVEALGASLVMKPKVFAVLSKLGLLPLLITEKPQVISAHALAAITAPESSTYYEQGKIFYRAWLYLTKLSLFGAPLSLLTDDKSAVEMIKSEFDLKNKALVNVLRVGFLPTEYKRYKPARLEGKELLITQ